MSEWDYKNYENESKWTSYSTLISINNIEEYIYLLFDIYLFEYFWSLGFKKFCSEKLLKYIICIDVNITCTYTTMSKNRSFRAYALNGWPQDCLHYFLYDTWRKVPRAECTKTCESKPSKDHQCLYWLSWAMKVLIKNAKSFIFTTVKGKRLITNLSVVDPVWPTPSPGLLCYISINEEDRGTMLLVYLVFLHPSYLRGCVCLFFESAEVTTFWRQNVIR